MGNSLAGKITKVRFLSAGDRALVVEFGDRVDRKLSEDVLRLNATIRSRALEGVIETVPTFRSLMIHFDPLVINRRKLEQAIEAVLGGDSGSQIGTRLWHIPVCYEGQLAPDLADVALLTGLTPSDVVAMHTGTIYHVYMLGFLPGFPYLGDLPAELSLPRRADPRVRVPPGSIAIATSLSAIYPYESPGGWHLIGTTPLRLFDLDHPKPALLAPGDAVLFQAVDRASYERIRQAIESRSYEVESEPIAA
jgi:inhibitor of KinA